MEKNNDNVYSLKWLHIHSDENENKKKILIKNHHIQFFLNFFLKQKNFQVNILEYNYKV